MKHIMHLGLQVDRAAETALICIFIALTHTQHGSHQGEASCRSTGRIVNARCRC